MFLLQDKEPRGIIPLENLSIREVEEPRKPVSVALLEISPLDNVLSTFLGQVCSQNLTVAHH